MQANLADRRAYRWVILVLCIILASVFAVIPRSTTPRAYASTSSTSAPSAPPVELCSGGADADLLDGPAAAPGAWSSSTSYSYSDSAPVFVTYSSNLYELAASASGASEEPSGSTSSNSFWDYVNDASGGVSTVSGSSVPGSVNSDTVYFFTAGTHSGDIDGTASDVTFLGQDGAILSGGGSQQYAVQGSLTNVTFAYLTVEDYEPGSGGVAVNADTASGWTVEYSTFEDMGTNEVGSTEGQPGSGLGIGSNMLVTYNCFINDATAGLQTTGNPTSNVTVTYNEMTLCGGGEFNPTNNDPDGVSAGEKNFLTTNETFDDNYVHDNYDPGLWADTDNVGWSIEGNYFARNWSEGIDTEISYNFTIEYNAFVDNGWGNGAYCDGCAWTYGAAIYAPNSGADTRVSTSDYPYTIAYNEFVDNWDGVVYWDDADRFGGPAEDSPWDGPNSTLVDPSEANWNTCVMPGLADTPGVEPSLFEDCQWKVENELVTDNNFIFDPTRIENSENPDGVKFTFLDSPPVSDCSDLQENWCGVQGMFSIDATTAPYSNYDGGFGVGLDMANNYNNVFSDNCYAGNWTWWNYDVTESVDWSQWTGGFDDTVAGTGAHIDGQDAGSTDTSSVSGCSGDPGSGSGSTTTTTTPDTMTTTTAPDPTTTTTATTSPGGTLTVATASLPEAISGSAYHAEVEATGGVPPYTFKKIGVLPKGLKLSDEGLFHGKAKKAGTTVFLVRVTDASGESVVASLSITVARRG